MAKRHLGVLLHVGTNLWTDVPEPEDMPPQDAHVFLHPEVRFSEAVWREAVERMVRAGVDRVVMDLGEAVVYPSHPELAIPGSLSPDWFRHEVARLKGLGVEAIPKLNFSAAHDAWLGEYSRMVSTPEYYRVCSDLIGDVAEIFGRPRLFHLGYDEETAQVQRNYAFSVVRQGGLWWHDFLWFVGEVERRGMRPWIWSDYYWGHREDFLARMPRSVLQSNWYYGPDLETPPRELEIRQVRTYDELDRAGFDQVPCASTWVRTGNFAATVDYCRRRLSPERLKGFLMAPWRPTTEAWKVTVLDAIDRVAAVSAEETAG